MCLLTFILENAELDYEDAKEASKSNPDGFGFAIHTPIGIIHDKDMDFEKLWLRWTDLRKTYKSVSLWHFRITTHGITDIENCHPFVTNDGKSVLAHNGILPLTMPVNESRSDTRIFTEVILPAMGGVTFLDQDKNFNALENWASGNKIVILSCDPDTKYDYYIINEKLGHWKNSVWFSNSSYKKFTYASYAYTGFYDKQNKSYTSSYANQDEDWEMWETDFLKPKTPENQLSLWEETMEYLQDELYPNPKIFSLIKIFTEYSLNETATVTCYNCGLICDYDPMVDFSPTHCGNCKTCLACNNNGCGCWENYEYGENYFNTAKENQSF